MEIGDVRFISVTEDMDIADSPLMGAHGYCTQEMVHLFLLGNNSSLLHKDMFLVFTNTRCSNYRNLYIFRKSYL